MDVGQGDGALLRMPDGAVFLIDGGSSSEQELWERQIGQTLKYYGIRTVDAVFLSHADLDHMSGILEFLQAYEPGLSGTGDDGWQCQLAVYCTVTALRGSERRPE